MKKLFVILIISSAVFLGASSSMKDKLLGVWKIQSMDMKEGKMRHEQLGLPYMEFNEEGGFLIKMGPNKEKGRYTLKGNVLKLHFLYPKKPAQEMVITKLDATELDYYTTDSTHRINVVCYKITQGLSDDKDEKEETERKEKKEKNGN